jgi:hypothetical protein
VLLQPRYSSHADLNYNTELHIHLSNIDDVQDTQSLHNTQLVVQSAVFYTDHIMYTQFAHTYAVLVLITVYTNTHCAFITGSAHSAIITAVAQQANVIPARKGKTAAARTLTPALCARCASSSNTAVCSRSSYYC